MENKSLDLYTLSEKRKLIAKFINKEFFNEFSWKDLMDAVSFIERNFPCEFIIRRNICEVKSLNDFVVKIYTENPSKEDAVFAAIFFFVILKK